MFYPSLLSTLHQLPISLRQSLHSGLQSSSPSDLLFLWFHIILLPAMVILLNLRWPPLCFLNKMNTLLSPALHMLLTSALSALPPHSHLAHSTFSRSFVQISLPWWGLLWPPYSKLAKLPLLNIPLFTSFLSISLITI